MRVLFCLISCCALSMQGAEFRVPFEKFRLANGLRVVLSEDNAVPVVAFRNWQNTHSIIGSFEDLNAATVDDVAKFFKTYYAPNNAVLAVVGDIRAAEARKLVESYFGDLKAQPQPKHPDLAEPSRAGARSEVYRDPLAKVPAVIVGYPGPRRRSADYNALMMADVLFTGGESSRFQLNLVKGRQSVVRYEANLGWPLGDASDYKDPGLYAMFFLHNPKFTGRQVVAQVEEEIDKIRKQGVDGRELERARTFLRSARITELQRVLSRARLLAQYELFDGKPEWITQELDAFLAVTPAQIQAAVKKYLVPEKRVVLEIVPAPKATPPTEGK